MVIPNKQIEEMFFKIATGAQVAKYVHLPNTGLATAYASDIVYRKFMEAVSKGVIRK